MRMGGNISNNRCIGLIVILILLNTSFLTLGIENGNKNRIQPNNSLEKLEFGVGSQINDNFGWNVSYASNLNGDQYDDIIIGAPGNDSNGQDAGAVYIFYGNKNPSSLDINADNANIILTGESFGDSFGWDVSSAGDVNYDGIDDIIIGAPGYHYNTGNAYIFYGGSLSNGSAGSADVKLNGTSMGDFFGHSVDGAGDVNGDNFDDIIVGAPGIGKAYIFYGSNTMATDFKPAEMFLATSRVIENGVDQNNYTLTYISNNTRYNVSAGAGWINGEGDFRLRFKTGITDDTKIKNIKIHIEGQVYGTGGAGIPIEISIHDFDNNDDDEDTVPQTLSSIGIDEVIEWNYLTSSAPEPVTAFINESNNGRIEIWFHREGWSQDGGTLLDYVYVETIYSHPNVTLIGQSVSDKFGSCVAGIGDFNGGSPSYDEVVVGAPLTARGSAYIFYGGNSLPATIMATNADVKFIGIIKGELFGWSISGAGDINFDYYDDLIVGAPAGDRSYIYFGKTTFSPPPPIYPNLWDDNLSTPNIVDFDNPGNEVNSLANTFGLGSPPSAIDNDGWDWNKGTYGQNLKGGPVGAHHYDPEPETEGLTFDSSKRLEVQVGPSHAGSDGSTNEIMDSAAWGVQINITTSMYSIIANGGEAMVSFDWEAQDTDGPSAGTEEPSYVKARFGNSTGYYYLGTNIGGDTEPELFFHQSGALGNPWPSVQNHFQGVVTQYIDKSGWYYLDFGAKFDATSGWQTSNEGIRAYFDNISMAIHPRIPQDIMINGTLGDKFGFSVSTAGKLNNDDFDDIIIGAPSNNTPNGANSGATYVFFGNGTMNSYLDATSDADYINYGETANDNFGQSVAHAGSVDGDAYSEVLVGAPYKDSPPPGSLSDVGKVYVLGLFKRPIVSLIYPIGGEVINDEIIINATATDPDNNIDAVGVRFYYSTDKVNWTYLGNNPTPDGTFYTMIWNTSELNDSNTYYIKVNVTDLEFNLGEDISGSFTIDNQFPPEVRILKPQQNEIISGKYIINASGFDSIQDQVGGGINNTLGMRFYYSNDNITWHYLGNDIIPNLGIYYEFQWDTIELVDGDYWIKANITDLDNLVAEDIVEFEIDNPSRAPTLNLIYPKNELEISGIITINATAFDMDNDINSTGVSFYYSKDNETWKFINNDPTPDNNLIYNITWNTTTVEDEWYWIKAFVNDTTGLFNESKSNEFLIHNTIKNRPVLAVIFPNNGEELNGSVKLQASAFDIDNNIDSDGVKFYYSSDKTNWIYIGNKSTSDTVGSNYYSYIWNTEKVPDGRYWLNVSANDTTFLTGWDISDERFFIHNTDFNPPYVDVIYPNGDEILSGLININATAVDLENNINTEGVKFYYSPDPVTENSWVYISNDATPEDNKLFSIFWDTTKVSDGKYWIKAEAIDTSPTPLIGNDTSDNYFYIHNLENNTPIIQVIYPNGGETLNGTVALKVSAFDLEDNINPIGVKYYYSDDNKKSWKLIGNISEPSSIENKIYKLTWDTTTVPDGIYWLKANATDLINLEGFDISDDSFIIHNNLNNPPKVKIIKPQANDTIEGTIDIQVEVTDFEYDVVEVKIYYSEDNEDWVLIGTVTAPTEASGNIYTYSWSTEDVYDGEYWLKVVAIDNNSLEGIAYCGPFSVENGIEPKKEKDDVESTWWFWIIVIIIIIVIILFAMLITKRRKKEKEEKEEETEESKPEEKITPEDSEEHLEEESPAEEPKEEEPPSDITDEEFLKEKELEEESQIEEKTGEEEQIETSSGVLKTSKPIPRIITPKVKSPGLVDLPKNSSDTLKKESEIENDEE